MVNLAFCMTSCVHRKGKRHRKQSADGNSLAFEVTGNFCLSVSQ